MAYMVNLDHYQFLSSIYRGFYLSVQVLLNLLNKLRKSDKMRGLPSILSLFLNLFNELNKTSPQIVDSIYHRTLKSIKNHIFLRENVKILSFYVLL